MRSLLFSPLLLLSLLFFIAPSTVISFAQEDSQESAAETTSETVEEISEDVTELASETDPLTEKTVEAANLLIGNFLQQHVQAIDISFLSPFDTERITVIEHGYLPSDNGPAGYWLLEVENISQDYLKPMNVLTYLSIRQETADGLRSFVEMDVDLYPSPNAQWSAPFDIDTLQMAPGSVWQIRLSTPTLDPLSDYALVNRLINEDIHVGLPESSEEERLLRLIVADPNFSPEDYQQRISNLASELEELKQTSREQALADFDQVTPQPVEMEILDLAITDKLHLIEHGVEETEDSPLTSAYWIFKVEGSQESLSTDSEESEDVTETNSLDDSDQAVYHYIAEDLWPFKGVQELSGLSAYDVPLDLTLVVPTEGGLYMPLEQPTYQAAAKANWQGYLKLSLPIISPLHDHYLDYQGERFDIIGDWGSSDFN